MYMLLAPVPDPLMHRRLTLTVTATILFGAITLAMYAFVKFIKQDALWPVATWALCMISCVLGAQFAHHAHQAGMFSQTQATGERDEQERTDDRSD
jgi:hypothetical protein